MLVLTMLLHLGQLSLLVLMSLHQGQRTSVELLLSLGLLAWLGAYLRQNELGVLNGERTREGGRMPSVRDLRHQLLHRANRSRYLYIGLTLFLVSLTMNGYYCCNCI